jgi:hydroxyacylglutathione hydrolase
MKLLNELYAYLWPGLTMAEMQRYGNNCNSYVIANALTGNKHVMIDPGQIINENKQNCFDKLSREMKKDNLLIEDIGLIIITHSHSDHYAAAAEIKKISGARIAIGKKEDEFTKAAGRKMIEFYESMGFKIPELKPDLLLNEGDLHLDKDIIFQIMLTPGHSPGHIGIYWPSQKVYFAGDLIFYRSTGRVDFPGGSAKLLIESIEKVAQLDIEYILTGHQYGGPGIIEGKKQIEDNFEYIRKNVFSYL